MNNKENNLIVLNENLSKSVNSLHNSKSSLSIKSNEYDEISNKSNNEDDNLIKNNKENLNQTDNNEIHELELDLTYNNISRKDLSILEKDLNNDFLLNENDNSFQNNNHFIIKQPSLTEPINLLTRENNIKIQEYSFYEIEQKNLFYLASLIINNIVNNISPLTKILECNENLFIQDFFNINEFILKHSLKSRKGLIFGKKDLWNMFESLQSINVHASEIIRKVREFSNVKTNIGRVRAFMRLAFVHKVYGKLFQNIIEDVDLLATYYDEGAFMVTNLAKDYLFKLSELDEFDFKWCAKDENLDDISTLINLIPYWKSLNDENKNVVYKFSVDKKELNDLLDEKKFYESKSNEFRNRILFYHNRIKELDIESLFRIDLVKNSSVLDLVTKKLGEYIKTDKMQDLISLKEDIQTLKKQMEIELAERVSKEAALESIERDVLRKQDENIQMREEIYQLKSINEDLCTRAEQYIKLNKELNENLVSLSSKDMSLMQTLVEVQRNLVSNEAKCNHLLQQNLQLKKENDNFKEQIKNLNMNNEKEKLDNQLLNDKLNKNLDEKTILKSELFEIKDKLKNCSPLQKKIDTLQLRCSEYEQTMEELGNQLQKARLEIENLKEQRIPRDAIWKDDKLVNNCEACNIQFTLGKRKHHCRYCGYIFCNSCSDNKIPLPAGSKPLRVCDRCNYVLLERYSAK